MIGVKILVLGCCGAGKSTLARQLSAKTGLPLIHLDQHYWKANWEESAPEEWENKVQDLASGETWIIDGNYAGTLSIRLAKADTIILLDFPTYICLWQVVKRWRKYRGRTRPDMGANCPERIDWEFFKYVYTFNRKKRPKLLNRLSNLDSAIPVYTLKNRRAVYLFLQSYPDKHEKSRPD